MNCSFLFGLVSLDESFSYPVCRSFRTSQNIKKKNVEVCKMCKLQKVVVNIIHSFFFFFSFFFSGVTF